MEPDESCDLKAMGSSRLRRDANRLLLARDDIGAPGGCFHDWNCVSLTA
jgi:hypothetical protein